MANTLKIKVENENVLTQSIINGIDPNNIIASYSQTSDSPTNYVIPDDGLLLCGCSQNMGRSNEICIIKSDSTASYSFMGGYFNNSGGNINYGVLPVKKGQTIRARWLNMFLYGIKR